MQDGPRLLHIGPGDEGIREMLRIFRQRPLEVHSVERAERGLSMLAALGHEVVLLESGAEAPGELLLERALTASPASRVVVAIEEPNVSAAARLGRIGAWDCVWSEARSTSAADTIRRSLEGALRDRTRTCSETPEPFRALIGSSKPMRAVVEVLRLIAPRQSSVLINGRTGTGKELVARAIHAGSPRAAEPLVMVDCGAIPATLVESELFGHEKGSFTGAVGRRRGSFERAHRGTIFLDEVGELPLEAQAKLLRVLQEREFQRVGGSETVRVDVRVVAATNRDLGQMVRRGEFREDLYYRLNVVPIALPSLAERKEDLPTLTRGLLERICRAEGLPLKRVSVETVARLMSYDWPGNVRQLENAIAKAVTLSGNRLTLFPSDFPLPSAPLRAPESLAPEVKLPAGGLDYDRTVAEFERSLLEQALEMASGNKKRAADLLRVKRTTFAARWKSLRAAAPRAD